MIYDIIIVGAGPAGLTAGIYALRAGKKIKIFESSIIGGHITSSPMVCNYPSITSASGMEIADKIYEQFESLGGFIDFETVEKIENADIKVVKTDYDTYKCKTIIIATGTNYRLLGLENEENLIGSGISFCVTCDGAFYAGKDVAVVGGGNSAIIEALELSKICNKVYMIVREDDIQGEEIERKKVKSAPNIEVKYQSTVTRYIGQNELEKIEINGSEILTVAGVFLAIGQSANIDIIDDIKKDEYGFVYSDENCTTNFEGIFVAGDVKSKKIRQLTTATSDGTIAALEAIKYLDKK